MRGTIAGPTPYPIGTMLPAVYQEDPFAMGLTAGLDDVLAAVIGTIDCIDWYVDPLITPFDFLEWLGGWVGALMDENAPEDRLRALWPVRWTCIGDAARLVAARAPGVVDRRSGRGRGQRWHGVVDHAGAACPAPRRTARGAGHRVRSGGDRRSG